MVGYLTSCNNTIIIAKNKDIIVFNVSASPKKNQVHIEKLIILNARAKHIELNKTYLFV